MTRSYGWNPELTNDALLKHIRRSYLPENHTIEIDEHVFDQEEIGSCTSNAIISAFAHTKKKVQKIIQDFFYTITKENLVKQ